MFAGQTVTFLPTRFKRSGRRGEFVLKSGTGYRQVGIQLHATATLSKASSAHGAGHWVGSILDLDAVARRKVTASASNETFVDQTTA